MSYSANGSGSGSGSGGGGVDYTAPQLVAAAAASVAAHDIKQQAATAGAAAAGTGAAAAATTAGASDAKNGSSSSPLLSGTDHIYLVGDSVLDNFIWLSHPKTKNLTEQLRAAAPADAHTVHNYAVDESVSADILRGKVPGYQYVQGRLKYDLEGYPTNPQDGKVYPLDLIAAHAKSTLSASKTGERGLAIVSVGGNDARIQLAQFSRGGGAAVLSAMETPSKYTHNGFTKNLAEITDKLQALSAQHVYAVLVLCYLPHKSFLPPHTNDLKQLVEHVSKHKVLPLAAKHKLPVIDLSRTFDPNNGAHYGQGKGSSPIEPSDLSTGFIVRLIAAVASDFKFGTDASKVYYGADKVVIEPNPLAAAL